MAKNAGDLPSGHGACLGRRSRTITVVDEQPKVWIWTRPVHCLRQGNVWENRPAGVGPSLTIFFTSVLDCLLMANARGNSALWDEYGRLIFAPIMVHYC